MGAPLCVAALLLVNGVRADPEHPEDGVGPLFHRTYELRVHEAELSPQRLMARLQVDPDLASPSEFARSIKVAGEAGAMHVGEERRQLQLEKTPHIADRTASNPTLDHSTRRFLRTWSDSARRRDGARRGATARARTNGARLGDATYENRATGLCLSDTATEAGDAAST